MVVPTKILSVPKLEMTTYTVDLLLIVFKLYCACYSRKIQKQVGGGQQGEGVEDTQIPGVGILKK